MNQKMAGRGNVQPPEAQSGGRTHRRRLPCTTTPDSAQPLSSRRTKTVPSPTPQQIAGDSRHLVHCRLHQALPSSGGGFVVGWLLHHNTIGSRVCTKLLDSLADLPHVTRGAEEGLECCHEVSFVDTHVVLELHRDDDP